MQISLLLQIFIIYLVSTITTLTNFSYAYSQCQDDQKTLLLELKSNLSFDASVSRKLVKWDQREDCCKWEGVECDAAGHVISLLLDYEAISGGFESSANLVSLKHLQKLSLAHNSLNGSMHWSLYSLPSSLEQLILSNNRFSGEVDEFPSPNLSNLVELDLSGNFLQGTIPDYFFNLESLEILSLSNNLFNGTFQLEKLRRLPNLTALDLSYNNLSINTALFGIPHLKKLRFASCNLQKIPDLIKQPNLNFLDLSDNQITGEIPSWIWEIGNGSLYHLNLSHNHLVDLQKPYHIPNFLAELDLHSNQLRGELPLLPRGASYIDFSDNKFDKPIPLDFVSSNFFLIFLSIKNNFINGSIPTSICSAITVKVIDFSNNNLSDGIPPCLVASTSSLQVLNIGQNNMSGDIPDKFSNNCKLRILDLSYNKLGGSFPKSLGNCKPLELVNVGRNKIEGSFPCMLPSRLQVLVLRYNRFEGEVKCGESWENLQIIDIANNNFSGDLHHISFSSWKKMVNLDINTETRRGIRSMDINAVRPDIYYLTQVSQIYPILKGSLNFKLIDLSSNNFQGEIPDAIGNLSSIIYLNLSHNALTGTIPKSIGDIEELVALDLSVNQLTGLVPQELTQLSFLEILNLSYNNLVGKIPDAPQFTTFDSNSYLGNPGLCGLPLSKTCHNYNISSAGNDSAHVHTPLKKRLNSSDENDSSCGGEEIESAALAYVVSIAVTIACLLNFLK